jgi:hypothetical protein
MACGQPLCRKGISFMDDKEEILAALKEVVTDQQRTADPPEAR